MRPTVFPLRDGQTSLAHDPATADLALGANAAHLCVDMQRLFSSAGPWAMLWMERVLPNVARLVERAPERTLFTRFIPPLKAEEAHGRWRAYYRKWANLTRERLDASLLDLMPELARHVPPARVFDKFVYSAFANGELHPFLRKRGVDTLIVSGSETDVCVLSSALQAVDLGYRVVIARDCVCSASDESHDALLSLYSRRFSAQIEVAEAEEILEAWRSS